MVKSKSLDDIAIAFESILGVIQKEDWTITATVESDISQPHFFTNPFSFHLMQ